MTVLWKADQLPTQIRVKPRAGYGCIVASKERREEEMKDLATRCGDRRIVWWLSGSGRKRTTPRASTNLDARPPPPLISPSPWGWAAMRRPWARRLVKYLNMCTYSNMLFIKVPGENRQAKFRTFRSNFEFFLNWWIWPDSVRRRAIHFV